MPLDITNPFMNFGQDYLYLKAGIAGVATTLLGSYGKSNLPISSSAVGGAISAIGVLWGTNRGATTQESHIKRAALIGLGAAAGPVVAEWMTNGNISNWMYPAAIGALAIGVQKVEQEVDYRKFLPDASFWDLL